MNFRVGLCALVSLTFFGGTTANAADVARCDAELVRAFSDVYKEDVTRVTSEQVFKKTCSDSSSSSGMSISVPIKGVPISFGGSSNSVRSACATHSRAFFEDYKYSLLVMKASDSVKENLVRSCFGGVSLVAEETNSGIVVTAFGQATGDHPVQVSDFNSLPKAGAEAINDNFKPDSIVSMRGTTSLFERKTKKAIAFALNTKKDGSASITVPGLEIIRVTWGFKSIKHNEYPYLFFQCMGQIGPAAPFQAVGGVIDAREMGIQGLGRFDLRSAACMAKYGPVIRFEPGSNDAIHTPDTWKISPVDKDNPAAAWTCTRNGKLMSNPIMCPNDPKKDKVCQILRGQQTYCIQAYQDALRDQDEEYRDLSEKLPEPVFEDWKQFDAKEDLEVE
jgi:hypothetical protein